MRVLIFGRMYTEPIHREKFQYITNSGKFDITVVAPTLWRHTLSDYEFKPATEEEKFKIIPGKISFSGKYFQFFYHGISRLLKECHPDLIEIDEEPASRACYSIIKKARRILPSSKIVVWTSEDTVKKRRFPLSYFEKYTLSQIDHIIACNPQVESLLREKGYKKAISVFQFLGTSPEIFKPQDVSGLKRELNLKNEFVAGYVGRLVEGKGLETLLKAVSLLDDRTRLLMVGKGESLDTLLELTERLGLKERVIFAGAVPHKEVPRYINCMDVLVLPSDTWNEKFGYVLPQAMLCEVPVIGSRHAGIPHAIGGSGLLFNPGDEKDLAQKINILKEDTNLRRHYIEAGKKRALENYTVEKVVERLIKVYEETQDDRL